MAEKNALTAVYSKMGIKLCDAMARRGSMPDLSDEFDLGGKEKDAYAKKPPQKKAMRSFYAESRFYHGLRSTEALEPCCLVCNTIRVKIRCFSCAKYEPDSGGYFCSVCFAARHPEHRAHHKWTKIQLAQDLGRELRNREQLNENKIYAEHLSATIEALRPSVSILNQMDADYRCDDLIKSAKRTLRDQTLKLQCAAHSLDLSNSLVPEQNATLCQFSPAIAILTIQRAWRRHHARKCALSKVIRRFSKLTDESSGYFYFVDLKTQQTSWEPPRLLWSNQLRNSVFKRQKSAPLLLTNGNAKASKQIQEHLLNSRRTALARAASVILTPRSHASEYGEEEFVGTSSLQNNGNALDSFS